MEISCIPGESLSIICEKQAKDIETSEVETMTEKILHKSTGMNTRPLKDAEVQIEIQKTQSEDSGDLVSFISLVEPLMSKELSKTTKAFQCNFKSDYQIDWNQDEPSVLTHNIPGPKIEEIKKTQASDDYFGIGGATEKHLSVSSMSWHPKSFTIAIGYSNLGHTGWCGHKSFVRIHNLSNSKQNELEIEGCVSSLCFSSYSTNLLAIGTYNGILLLWNIEKADFVTRSSIDEYQHREAITGILWIKELQYPVFTISTDGKVLNWSSESFEFPIRGFLIKGKHDLEGGDCFSVTEDRSAIIIGAESGKILKLNIPSIINQPLISEGLKIKPEAELVLNNLNPTYRQQLLNLARKYCMDHNLKEIDTRAVFFNKPDILKCYSSKVSLKYESHDGPVSGICCNPFHRNLFVSSSYDGTVKLFNGLQKDAIIVLEPVLACKVSCVAWSEVRPLLLAVGSENGSVYFYDFLQSNTNFVAEITNSRNSVVDLKFHKGIKDYLAIGFRNGEVRVYSLPDVFTVAHPDEGRRLRLLLENIFYE